MNCILFSDDIEIQVYFTKIPLEILYNIHIQDAYIAIYLFIQINVDAENIMMNVNLGMYVCSYVFIITV